MTGRVAGATPSSASGPVTDIRARRFVVDRALRDQRVGAQTTEESSP